MLGRSRTALTHFAEARRLYADLQDRVSYAYTLWGEGTLYKVSRQLKRAGKVFAAAEKIFIETRDPRGCIYTRLGRGEILILQGKRRLARRLLERTGTTARRHGFRIEALHTDLLLALLDRREGKRASIASLRRRYEALGSTILDGAELPLNLP
jgi:hypothetical protein